MENSVSGSVVKTFDFTKKSWKDDVTFIIGDNRLYASKCVLALFSPVFEAMFGSDFKEKDRSEIELPEKNVEEFTDFLQCLYPNSNTFVTPDNVLKILPLADEYQVPTLMKECKAVIEEILSSTDLHLRPDKLLKCYAAVNSYGLPDLEPLVMREILRQGKYKTYSNAFEKHLSKDMVIKLQSDIISEQETRLEEVTTEFLKFSFKSNIGRGGTDISQFENAKGARITLVVDDVFGIEEYVSSKPLRIWNLVFTVIVSVGPEENSGLNEKYMAIYIECTFPDEDDGWACNVKAQVSLENLSTAGNKSMSSDRTTHKFTNESQSWGFPTFEKLSKFLAGTEKTTKNYSCKILTNFLVNKPTKDQLANELND